MSMVVEEAERSRADTPAGLPRLGACASLVRCGITKCARGAMIPPHRARPSCYGSLMLRLLRSVSLRDYRAAPVRLALMIGGIAAGVGAHRGARHHQRQRAVELPRLARARGGQGRAPGRARDGRGRLRGERARDGEGGSARSRTRSGWCVAGSRPPTTRATRCSSSGSISPRKRWTRTTSGPRGRGSTSSSS